MKAMFRAKGLEPRLAVVAILAILLPSPAIPKPPTGVSGDYRSDPERDRSESTSRVLAAVAAAPGMTIVDVGAGFGYFAFKFAAMVGPTGRVVATDIDPVAVRAVAEEAAARGATQVVAIEVQPNELGVTGGGVDVIVMVNSYRFDLCPNRLGDHLDYLLQCREALADGGRLVIHRDWLRTTAWRPSHRTQPLACDDASALDVTVWAMAVGFEVLSVEVLDYQKSEVVGEYPGYQVVLRRE